MNEGTPISALERILRRLQLLVGRGRITTGNDAGGVQLQQVQVNDRETHDDMPRIVEYGFTSMPNAGCQALVIFVGGERTNGVIFGTNDESHRLKNLQPGEVAIYDDLGQSVWIKRGGIVIDGGGKQVTITNTPKVRVESNIEATGTIKDLCDSSGETMDGMRTIYDSHTHPDPQGGNTGTPNQLM